MKARLMVGFFLHLWKENELYLRNGLRTKT